MNKAVANVLNKVLGDWIKDLNPDQLNLSIFSGEVSLENLNLKETILHALGFPFDLCHGSVGKIKVSIPWTSLLSSSLSIEISDVFAYLTPKSPNTWTEKYEIEACEAEKHSNLQRFEALSSSDLKEATSPGYFGNYAKTIVNNIQISINNVYIRYEDTISSTDAFAFGLSLKNLIIQTCNKDWKPEYISECDICYKLISINSFKCFCDYDVKIIKFRDFYAGDIKQAFRKLAQDDLEGLIEHNYILNPFYFELQIKIALKPSFDAPQYDINFQAPKFFLDFYSGQIKIFLKFGEFMKLYKKFQVGVTQSIGEANFEEESEKQYSRIYKFMKNSVPDSEDHKQYMQELVKIEKKVLIDDIKRVRSKSMLELDHQKKINERIKERDSIADESVGVLGKVTGYFSWSSEDEKKKKQKKNKEKSISSTEKSKNWKVQTQRLLLL